MSVLSRCKRWISMIAYHHLIMSICAVAIVLTSILLAGCTSSNGLRNVYLLSLRYSQNGLSSLNDAAQVNPGIGEQVYNVFQPSDNLILDVRAAYIGICLTRSDGSQFCSRSAAALASMVRDEQGGSNSTADPLNLIWIAKNFQERIVFDGLIFLTLVLIFICFLICGTFPGWHEEVDEDGSERDVQPFPARPMTQAALAAISLAFIFGLIAMLWQHVNSSAAASMAESLSYGAIEAHVGTTAMVLGWAAVLFIAVAALGIMIMILSISLIRKLMEDD